MKTWYMNNTNIMFVFEKKIYVVHMAILMSNIDNFDNAQ